jgi:hypothetical protein
MSWKRLATLGLVVVFAAAAPSLAPAALGQAANPPAAAPDSRPHHMHIEGHIAYLKAELKITPAQEALWEKVADAMRQQAKTMESAMGQMRGKHDQQESAIEHMEGMAKFAQLHAEGSQRMLTAFRPLYDSLSPDQKKAADELFAHHHHHGRF